MEERLRFLSQPAAANGASAAVPQIGSPGRGVGVGTGFSDGMGWVGEITSVGRGVTVAVGGEIGVKDGLGNAVGRRGVSLGSTVLVDLGVGVAVSQSRR